jgi:hypothetical protein
VVIGWQVTGNEINLRLPTTRTGVYAGLLINNGGSFPSGSNMIITTSNDDYYFQSSIGQIEFTIASDNDATHPFYIVRVAFTGGGGTSMIYAVVEKYV